MTMIQDLNGKNSEPATNSVKHLLESTNGRKMAARGNPKGLGFVFSSRFSVLLFGEG